MSEVWQRHGILARLLRIRIQQGFNTLMVETHWQWPTQADLDLTTQALFYRDSTVPTLIVIRHGLSREDDGLIRAIHPTVRWAYDGFQILRSDQVRPWRSRGTPATAND